MAVRKSYIASKAHAFRSVGSSRKAEGCRYQIRRKQQEQRVKDQKVKEVRSLNQEVLDQRGQDLSWRINR